MSLKTLAEVPYKQAELYHKKSAFLCGKEKLSFEQFDKRSNQVAQGILKEYIAPGSRIAFLGKDSFAGYEILFGLSKAKKVFLPINWRLAKEEVSFIIANSKTNLVFVNHEFLPLLEKINEEAHTTLKIIVIDGNPGKNYIDYTEWRSKQLTTHPCLEYDANDVVVQMYTSGTTGRPKGVQLTNNTFFQLLATMDKIKDPWMELNQEDILLISLPIFHIGGMWWAIQGFLSGGTGVILETFQAWKALEAIEKHRITKVAMVPAMIQFSLLEPNIDHIDMSSVKGFLYGGSPISTSLLIKAMQLFACDFFQVYGLTETGNMAVCLRPEDHTNTSEQLLKSVGKPLPGVSLKIVDTQHNVLPTNTIGEIWIKSPSNMVGYWENEIANKQTMIDGWICTGDAGYLNEEGYVFVCDRIKDMIIYADENVYPAEIENVLGLHENVKEVAVIGVPDDKWGEIVKAIVVPKDKNVLNKRILTGFLKGKIADYKIPKSFSFIDLLPRNPSGKVLKNELRDSFT